MAEAFKSTKQRTDLPQYTPVQATEVRQNTAGMLLEGIAGVAIEGTKIVQGAKLEGSPDQELPLNDDNQINLDEALSLRQIKMAREQGRMSPEVARAKVNQRIQQISNNIPALARNLRKRAAEFFGDFGPGEGLLSPEGASQQDKIFAAWLKDGVKAGYIDPYDPYADQKGQQLYRRRQLQQAQNEIRKENLELRGAVRADTREEAAFRADQLHALYSQDVDMAVLDMHTRLSSAIKQGERFTDPEALKAEVIQAKELAKAELRQRWANSNLMITQDQKDQYIAAIDEQFEPTLTMIDNGSLQSYLENKKKVIDDALYITGVERYPMLATVEAVAPGSARSIIEISPTLERLATVAQQKNFENLNPVERMSLNLMREDKGQFMLNFLEDLKEETLDIEGFQGQLNEAVAHSIVTNPNIPDEGEEGVKAKSRQFLLEYGSDSTLKDFAQPSVLNKVLNNPDEVEALKNKLANNQSTIIDEIGDALVSVDITGKPGRKGAGGGPVMEKTTKDYEIEITADKKFRIIDLHERTVGRGRQPAPLPKELQALETRLNAMNAIVTRGARKLGISPNEWRREIISGIRDATVEIPVDEQGNPLEINEIYENDEGKKFIYIGRGKIEWLD